MPADRVPLKRRARSYAGRAKRRLQAATDPSRRIEARAAADEALVNAFLAEMASERDSIDAETRTARAVALAARVSTTQALADLWGGLAGQDLGAGDNPANLNEAVRAELAWADELLANGDHDAAAGSFHQATRLLFHRSVHFDSTTSPLAEDPTAYTEVLRASRVYRTIVRNRGRAEKAATPPQDRPTRVLIATDGNTNFVQDLHEHLADVHEVEVRFIEPKDLAKARRFIGSRRHLVRTQLAGADAAAEAAEEDLREHLDWADVVFGDWCTGMAWYLTLVDPGTTRVILRLHSYEAWTLWPHLIDFSRVDVLVFVSEHLKELTQRAVPGVDAAGTTVVVPNAMNLQRFTLSKEPGARYTIGMLGFNVVAKDLQWTLEVVRRLRAHDDRYRLKLIGGSFDAAGTPALRRYRDEARRQIDELATQGAVELFGRTEDVPAALTDVGVIVSSSVREGSPLAVLEGAASGAVPVVRDWPFFRHLAHGPRTIYPADWVVSTIDDAVERILETTRDEAVWKLASASAQDFALSSFDLDTTRHAYEGLLFGS